MKKSFCIYGIALLLAGCAAQKNISKPAARLLNNELLKHAHTGICILDVESGKYIYQYQSDKYFVPASNTKVFTLYAGMKYLKDSLSIYLHPLDSFYRHMIQQSDNDQAEQTLLATSYTVTGIMSDSLLIDTLLKTDLKELPQQPSWVDGSGLSRYNLFTPQDLVWMLNKMKNEFGLDRLQNIFATGGQGTLKDLYRSDSGYIYAKTGTLSGQIALSGFLITSKNKLLIFSILVNNHRWAAMAIRRAIEEFLTSIRKRE